MTEIIHPSEHNFGGPFFIELDHLTKLDDILESEYKQLLKYREELIERKLQEQVEKKESRGLKYSREEIIANIIQYQPFSNEEKQVSIEFASGKIAVAANFAEIAKDPNLRKELPISFSASFSRAGISVSVSNKSYWSNKKLLLKVEPYCEQTQGIWFRLERWISEISATQWQQIWSKIPEIRGALFIIMLIVTGIMLASLPDRNANYAQALMAYKVTLKNEAHQLIKSGIKQDDLIKATEINLSIAADYLPENVKIEAIKYPKWPFVVEGLTLLLCLILAYPPKFHLGIGMGERAIKRWRGWLSILKYVVVTILGLDILLPILLAIMGIMGDSHLFMSNIQKLKRPH